MSPYHWVKVTGMRLPRKNMSCQVHRFPLCYQIQRLSVILHPFFQVLRCFNVIEQVWKIEIPNCEHSLRSDLMMSFSGDQYRHRFIFSLGAAVSRRKVIVEWWDWLTSVRKINQILGIISLSYLMNWVKVNDSLLIRLCN